MPCVCLCVYSRCVIGCCTGPAVSDTTNETLMIPHESCGSYTDVTVTECVQLNVYALRCVCVCECVCTRMESLLHAVVIFIFYLKHLFVVVVLFLRLILADMLEIFRILVTQRDSPGQKHFRASSSSLYSPNMEVR